MSAIHISTLVNDKFRNKLDTKIEFVRRGNLSQALKKQELLLARVESPFSHLTVSALSVQKCQLYC